MEIHIEFLTGKIITVYVEPSDTIQIVKMKIEEKEGIPPNKQSLMFSSNLLRDDRTLSFYGIRPDSVFHLLMKNHIWDRLNFKYSEKASKIWKISHLLDFTDFTLFSGYLNISWLQLFFRQKQFEQNSAAYILRCLSAFLTRNVKKLPSSPSKSQLFFKKKQMINEFFKDESRILTKKQLKWLIENVLLVDVIKYVKLFMWTKIWKYEK